MKKRKIFIIIILVILGVLIVVSLFLKKEEETALPPPLPQPNIPSLLEGKYPIETVLYMEKIINEVGKNLHLISTEHSWIGDSPNVAEVLGRAVHLISDASSLNIDAIVTSTRSGSTTRMIAKYRPEKKIIAGTPYDLVKRQLQMVWGVYPLRVKVSPKYNELLYEIVLAATEQQMLNPKDTILTVGGSLLGYPSKTNQLQILKVEDVLLYGQSL